MPKPDAGASDAVIRARAQSIYAQIERENARDKRITERKAYYEQKRQTATQLRADAEAETRTDRTTAG